jgi:hypothetical protein
MRRVAVAGLISVSLMLNGACASGNVIQKADDAIRTLDDALRAARLHVDDFDQYIKPGTVVESSVTRLLRQSDEFADGTFLRTRVDDSLASLRAEGENSLSAEVLTGSVCDVMQYYIQEGAMPSTEQIAEYLVAEWGEAVFNSPPAVADQIVEIIASLQSGQTAVSWVALQEGACDWL